MVTSAVQLGGGFYPQDLWSWYDGADVGELITVSLSSRGTAVRLIKRPKQLRQLVADGQSWDDHDA